LCLPVHPHACGENLKLYNDGGQHKGIIFCKTLAKQISEALGSENTNDWTGKRIVLFPQKLMVAGAQRVAIRARSANGKPTS